MVSFNYKITLLSLVFLVITLNKANAILSHNETCNNSNSQEVCGKGLLCKLSTTLSNGTAIKTCQCEAANTVFNPTSKECLLCKRGEVEENQLCVAAFGRTCTPTKGCNSDNLFCDRESKTCSCSLNYAPNVEKKNCFLRIGTSCADGLECGENTTVTECSNDPKFKNFCLCKKDYIPNFSLTNCYKGFNQSCTADNECNKDQGLSCIAGKCNCTLIDDQIYDKKIQLCASKLTKRCTVTSKAIQCASDTQCTRFNGNSLYGFCMKSESETNSGTTHSLFYPLFLVAYLFTFSTS